MDENMCRGPHVGTVVEACNELVLPRTSALTFYYLASRSTFIGAVRHRHDQRTRREDPGDFAEYTGEQMAETIEREPERFAKKHRGRSGTLSRLRLKLVEWPLSGHRSSPDNGYCGW